MIARNSSQARIERMAERVFGRYMLQYAQVIRFVQEEVLIVMSLERTCKHHRIQGEWREDRTAFVCEDCKVEIEGIPEVLDMSLIGENDEEG